MIQALQFIRRLLELADGTREPDRQLSEDSLLREISENPHCRLIEVDRNEAGWLIQVRRTHFGDEMLAILGFVNWDQGLVKQLVLSGENLSVADVVQRTLVITEKWEGGDALHGDLLQISIVPLWPANLARHV